MPDGMVPDFDHLIHTYDGGGWARGPHGRMVWAGHRPTYLPQSARMIATALESGRGGQSEDKRRGMLFLMSRQIIKHLPARGRCLTGTPSG